MKIYRAHDGVSLDVSQPLTHFDTLNALLDCFSLATGIPSDSMIVMTSGGAQLREDVVDALIMQGGLTESGQELEFFVFNRDFLYSDPEAIAKELAESPLLEPPLPSLDLLIGLITRPSPLQHDHLQQHLRHVLSVIRSHYGSATTLHSHLQGILRSTRTAARNLSSHADGVLAATEAIVGPIPKFKLQSSSSHTARAGKGEEDLNGSRGGADGANSQHHEAEGRFVEAEAVLRDRMGSSERGNGDEEQGREEIGEAEMEGKAQKEQEEGYARPHLRLMASLLAGYERDLDVLSRVRVNPKFFDSNCTGATANLAGGGGPSAGASDNAATGAAAAGAGGGVSSPTSERRERKERSLGDYVSRLKMKAVANQCLKVFDEFTSRLGTLEQMAAQLMADTRTLRAEVEGGNIDPSTATLAEAAAALERAKEIVELLEHGHRDAEKMQNWAGELYNVDVQAREAVLRLTDDKNDLLLHSLHVLHDISSLQSDLAELSSMLSEFDIELHGGADDGPIGRGFARAGGLAFRGRSDGFKHLMRLRCMLGAYAATVAEVVRRREFSRLLLTRSSHLAELLATLVSAERTRRQTYKREVAGRLPWTVQGFDEEPMGVEISTKAGRGEGGAERTPELGKEDLTALFSELDALELFLASSPPTLETLPPSVHQFLSTKGGGHGQDTVPKGLEQLGSIMRAEPPSPITEVRVQVQDMVQTIETLEKEFERAVERGLATRSISSSTSSSTSMQGGSRRNADFVSPAEVADLRAHLDHVSHALTEAEERLRTEHEAREEERSTLEVKLAQETERASVESRASKAMQDDLERAKAENAALKSRADSSTAAEVALRKEMEELRRELEDTRRNAAESAKELEAQSKRALALEQSVDELEEELDIVRKERDDARLETETLMAEKIGSAREAQSTEQEMKSLCDALEKAREEAREVRKALSEVEREKDRLIRDHIAETDSDRAILEEGLREKQEEVRALERELGEGRREIDELRAAAHSKALDHGKLEEEMKGKVESLTTLVKKWQKAYKSASEKVGREKEKAAGKIAFRNFQKGDLVLFLPTRNSTARPWAAFNISFPHYFLNATGQIAEQIKTKEWIVARISEIAEHVVDSRVPDSNPFQLGEGVKYYLLSTEPWTTPPALSSSSMSRHRKASTRTRPEAKRAETYPLVRQDAADETRRGSELLVEVEEHKAVSSPSHASDARRFGEEELAHEATSSPPAVQPLATPATSAVCSPSSPRQSAAPTAFPFQLDPAIATEDGRRARRTSRDFSEMGSLAPIEQSADPFSRSPTSLPAAGRLAVLAPVVTAEPHTSSTSSAVGNTSPTPAAEPSAPTDATERPRAIPVAPRTRPRTARRAANTNDSSRTRSGLSITGSTVLLSGAMSKAEPTLSTTTEHHHHHHLHDDDAASVVSRISSQAGAGITAGSSSADGVPPRPSSPSIGSPPGVPPSSVGSPAPRSMSFSSALGAAWIRTVPKRVKGRGSDAASGMASPTSYSRSVASSEAMSAASGMTSATEMLKRLGERGVSGGFIRRPSQTRRGAAASSKQGAAAGNGSATGGRG